MSSGKLLIVDDEKVAVKNLEHVMKKEGYEVTATQSGANAMAHMDKQQFDVVLTDLRMEKVDGLQILEKCRKNWPDTEVILITGYATLESAVNAMKQGAFNYIAKPFRLDEVRKVVAEAMEKIRLRRENVPCANRSRVSRARCASSPRTVKCSSCWTCPAKSLPLTAMC